MLQTSKLSALQRFEAALCLEHHVLIELKLSIRNNTFWSTSGSISLMLWLHSTLLCIPCAPTSSLAHTFHAVLATGCNKQPRIQS